MGNRKYRNRNYAFAVLAMVLLLGLTHCQPHSDASAVKITNPEAASQPVTATPSTMTWQTAIARVAEQNIPAVVHIEVTQRREISNPMLPFNNDPFFHFFFNGPQMPRKFKQELRGLGTGMFIDDQGHILTNNHVVAGATEINVLLADGKSFPAKLVGTDPKTDLAVIRISADEKLPAVTFGDSDKTAVGDWVVAIGHPRGLDQTVTQGIISAKHRSGVVEPPPTRTTCKPMRPSTRATAAGRCSIWTARSSASMPPSHRNRAVLRASDLPSPAIWPCMSPMRSSPTAK